MRVTPTRLGCHNSPNPTAVTLRYGPPLPRALPYHGTFLMASTTSDVVSAVVCSVMRMVNRLSRIASSTMAGRLSTMARSSLRSTVARCQS